VYQRPLPGFRLLHRARLHRRPRAHISSISRPTTSAPHQPNTQSASTYPRTPSTMFSTMSEISGLNQHRPQQRHLQIFGQQLLASKFLRCRLALRPSKIAGHGLTTAVSSGQSPCLHDSGLLAGPADLTTTFPTPSSAGASTGVLDLPGGRVPRPPSAVHITSSASVYRSIGVSTCCENRETEGLSIAANEKGTPTTGKRRLILSFSSRPVLRGHHFTSFGSPTHPRVPKHQIEQL